MLKRRKVRYKNYRFIFGIVILLILVGMGVGFSYLSANLTINGATTVSKNTWNVHFENLKVDSKSVNASTPATIDSTTTGVSFSVKLDKPGDVYSFTVDAVNSGSIDAMVSGLTKSNLTEEQSRYLEYIVTYSDGSSIIENELLNIGDSRKVRVIVKYKKDITTADLPTDTNILNLSFNISYVQADESAVSSLVWLVSKNAVLDNVASEYVTSSTGIDFSKISSDTNGKGVYMLSSTKDDINPIYYYRGAVTNNNVKFANFCWKIVRTTETGGIKLIYNGVPDENGYCDNIGDTAQIGESVYNTNSNDNAYVGYMYGTVGSSSYEETHKNTNDSAIKSFIDEWYSKNMTGYTSKLEDTVWCNDRSIVKDSIHRGNGAGTTVSNYGARDRLCVNKIPNLECKNANDRFTVNSKNGNGELTYPVALLTGDEVVYAGGVFSSENGSYYLYNNKPYWTLTSSTFDGRNAYQFAISTEGMLYHPLLNNTNYTFSVRPSISLSKQSTIKSGDGSVNKPYIVD